MIPIELGEPTWRRENFDPESITETLQVNLDVLDETREVAHVREYGVKRRAAQRYDSKVIPREMKEGDLVLRKITRPNGTGKFSPNWEGPYRVKENLPTGAYKLEELQGNPAPRTWNSANLRYYFS